MNVQITQLEHAKGLELPKFETAGAVGFDLSAAKEMIIEPGKIELIPTGLIIKTTESHALIIAPRSSTPRKKGLDMPHSIGVIDQDYCGPKDELLIQVRNFSDATVTVQRGEKIAQGMFVRVDRADWQEVDIDDVSHETRGGFGSTDTPSS